MYQLRAENSYGLRDYVVATEILWRRDYFSRIRPAIWGRRHHRHRFVQHLTDCLFELATRNHSSL